MVAAAVYPSGPFYRADLVTEFAHDARELVDVLFGTSDSSVPPSDAETRRLALAAVDRLLTRLAEHGVRHPDLNARNILLTRSSHGVEAILLDLDRCVVDDPPAPGDRERLRQRLVRSLRKLGHARPGNVSDEELAILMQGSDDS